MTSYSDSNAQILGELFIRLGNVLVEYGKELTETDPKERARRAMMKEVENLPDLLDF